MENTKRSKILSGINKIADKQKRKEAKLHKHHSKNTISLLNSLKLKAKVKPNKNVGTSRIEKALDLVSNEIKNYNLKFGRDEKILTLNSGVKILISLKSKSAFIITPDNENIALPKGSYDYKDKTIVISPDGQVKDIRPSPVDTLAPKINKLSIVPDQMKKSMLYQLLNKS